MIRWFSAAAAVALLLAAIQFSAVSPVLADNQASLDAVRQLLQKGLTVHEIDLEVRRLSGQESQTAKQLKSVEAQIGANQKLLSVKKERAAEVLRAYYMGDRPPAWLLLLNARSVSDALSVWEYLSRILANDQLQLTQYRTEFEKLQALRENLRQTESALQQVKAQFLAQRDRLLKMQDQLNKQLSTRKDADAIRQRIENLNQKWEKEGLPAFNSYLNAMADAMNHLNDYLNQYQSALKMNSLTDYNLTVNEADLNDFLQQQNPIFKNVNFTFDGKNMLIRGKQGDMEIVINGNFIVENKPVNQIRYVVSALTFDGFTLPDTRVRQLNQKYDLTFSPQKMAQFMKADSLSIQKGKMTIHLKLSLAP